MVQPILQKETKETKMETGNRQNDGVTESWLWGRNRKSSTAEDTDAHGFEKKETETGIVNHEIHQIHEIRFLLLGALTSAL